MTKAPLNRGAFLLRNVSEKQEKRKEKRINAIDARGAIGAREKIRKKR